jgi:hypothetical protein
MTMANDEKETEDKAINFLLETVEKVGVATSSVRDGQVFMFKRSYLVELLDKHIGQEKIVIFVKKPDTN